MKIARFNDGPEIFFSVQGEGKSVGRPSVFLRLSLCNLYCAWCDTDYTWNWRGTPFRHVRDAREGYRKYEQDEQIVRMEVAEVIRRLQAFPCRNVVLTGGEPLLQQSELVAVMRGARALDAAYWFEVETNGTITPSAEFGELVDQYNVSPKLSNSGVKREHRLRHDALVALAREPKAVFKFVVSSAPEVEELTRVAAEYAIAHDRIWVMPEASDAETLRSRQLWLAEVCLAQGFRLGDRLHIRLYGDQRGK